MRVVPLSTSSRAEHPAAEARSRRPVVRRHAGALKVAASTLLRAPRASRARRAELESLRSTVRAGLPFDISVLRARVADGVPLLLVHGTPGSATGWADYLLAPPPGTAPVALDRPGFGASGPARAVPSLELQAEAAWAALGEGAAPAILLGHSLGGAVVAQAALMRPERVRALILVAAALDPSHESTHLLQRVAAWRPVAAALPRALRNANAELMGFELQLRNLARALGRVRASVFIVHGTKDPLVPVDNVAFMRREFVNAAAVNVNLLAGSNHFLPWNASSVIRRMIGDALRGTS